MEAVGQLLEIVTRGHMLPFNNKDHVYYSTFFFNLFFLKSFFQIYLTFQNYRNYMSITTDQDLMRDVVSPWLYQSKQGGNMIEIPNTLVILRRLSYYYLTIIIIFFFFF